MSASSREPEPQLVSVAEVRAARDRIAGTCLSTPVLPLPGPGARDLWVKAESLQVTGSFKLRGALNALLRALEGSPGAGVVTYSAGNHGLALAYAARAAGVTASVVMPATASATKAERIGRWGAEVVRCEPDDIVTRTLRMVEDDGLVFVPPFDHRDVIAGQGTVGLEIAEQLPDVACVAVPVGGGGLVSGVAVAIKHVRPDVRVIGVEPALAADLAESVRTGTRATWTREETRRTIADGLRSPTVGELPWAHVPALVDDVVTVEETEIVEAMRRLAEDLGLLVEPSGAVAVAAALAAPDRLPPGPLVGVATGRNIALDDFTSLVGPA